MLLPRGIAADVGFDTATSSMGTIQLDGREVPIRGEKNLLELARNNGIDIPSFCYHSELSVYGACRMCLVEVEGRGVVASCSTAPEPMMVVRTVSPELQRLRKTNLELLLASHNRDCTTCNKNGSCQLQTLAQKLGLNSVRFDSRLEQKTVEEDNPCIVRDANKCILCGDCVRMCREVQGIGVLDFAYRGSRTQVTPAVGKGLGEIECVFCGQCVAICPTGALTPKSEIDRVWEAIADPDQLVIAQIAPAVRVSLGEEFGLPPGQETTDKIAAALRYLGVDRVFDTVFAADLTAMEETREFLTRLENSERLPLFTSCCPAWVKFCEQFHPELLENLSTCRSPQQMMGSLLKRLYAQSIGRSPEQIFVVSIMPCIAKKFEAKRPEFRTDTVADVDAVLTTVEAARMIRQAGIMFDQLEGQALDAPLSLASGAGVIFGVTGGVAEAVLRTAAGLMGEDGAGQISFTEVRRGGGIRGIDVTLRRNASQSGQEIRAAIVHGLGNAEELIKAIQAGEAKYDIVEVMACPNGCVGGGGQPVAKHKEDRQLRGQGLYTIDRRLQIQSPCENPHLNKVYQQWLETPNSEIAHHLLHTAYSSRRRIAKETIHGILEAVAEPAVNIAVCIGTGCFLRGSHQVLDRLVRLAEDSHVASKINLVATFCLEHCSEGVSVRVNDRILTGVNLGNIEEVFRTQMLPLINGSERRR